MTIQNGTSGSHLSKQPKSALSTSAAEKQSSRRQALNNSRAIPFAEIAKDPLYRQLALAICPKDLKAELEALYLDSPAQLAAFRSLDDLNVHLSKRTANDLVSSNSLNGLFARAKQEAIRGYRLMRHVLAIKDPLSQSLRHTNTNLPLAVEQALRTVADKAYAKPSSLQSKQSPAAYLRYLYRIATGLDQELGILPPKEGPYCLEKRRPDLAQLVLSETNLKQEIPTIELVNEVLESAPSDLDIGRTFYPIALPFDESAHLTRTALAQVGGTALNDIGVRTTQDDYPLSSGFTLVHDAAGLLGLTGTKDQSASAGSEIALLTGATDTELETAPLTLEELYGTADNLQAAQLSELQSRLDIDFDELTQLLGLYGVAQENGHDVRPGDYATVILNNDAPVQIVELNAGNYVYLKGDVLSPPDLRSLHYATRLYRATGIAFHQLNWLLAIPGVINLNNPDGMAHWQRSAWFNITNAGLRVLAGYRRYRDTFELTPEQYAALFGEICPFWRADTVVANATDAIAGLEQTEISFFRELFGKDAQRLHKALTDKEKPATILDAELVQIVGGGLRLTTAELHALVSELDAHFHLTSALDVRGLAALYRLTTLFRMLNWPLLGGMELAKQVSQQAGANETLWTHLTAKNLTPEETADLCGAIDCLVGLAQWMREAELSPETLITLLTPTVGGASGLDDIEQNWLASLANLASSTLASAETFRSFEHWDSETTAPVEITGEMWHSQLSSAGQIYPSSGVFRASTDRNSIDKACRHYLDAIAGVDLGLASNAKRLDRMVAKLVQTKSNQTQMLERHLATLSNELTAFGAGFLVTWAQGQTLDVLEALLQGPASVDAQYWMAQLQRHLSAADALGLGDIDLQTLGEKPQWLYTDAAKTPSPLCLEQLFYCQRFMTLQQGAATDAAWFGFLTLIHQNQPHATASAEEQTAWQAACTETLAILIGAPVADVALYVNHLFGAEQVADNLQKIDAVTRHARLAEELCIGASELLALKAVSDTNHSGSWATAASAARASIAKFKNGSQLTAFNHAFAEIKRDALIAAYMQTHIATDATLATTVTDREALYRYLLLDVNVTSQVPTSRLIEATSSLQLYINRALANLEPGIEFTHRQRLAAQWQIDKQYRQWEANQKLLLYPQNYIEPELRYITSPQFEGLQQAISGGDINEDSVEAAVNAYMAELAHCCELGLCSIYVERQDEAQPLDIEDSSLPSNATYHFLARAKWENDRFFYRKLEADYKTIATLDDPKQYLKAFDWTFWQEVVIPNTYALFSDVGVCFYLNRYYFSWLEIEERKTQTANGEQVSWRIYPRYMRCDAKALSGTTHTPDLFIEINNDDIDSVTVNDGGFVWNGNEPLFDGAYHPKLVKNNFKYGVLKSSTAGNATPNDVIFITFGVDLKSNSGSQTKNTIQIRISETWGDAFFIQDDFIDQRFQLASPDNFRPIHPRIIQADGLSSDQYNIKKKINPGSLYFTYEFNKRIPGEPFFYLVNNYNTTNAPPYGNAVLNSSLAGDNSIGSIAVDVALGDRRYGLFIYSSDGVSSDSHYISLTETSAVKLRIRIKLTWEEEGKGSEVTYTAWSEYDTQPLYMDLSAHKMNESSTDIKTFIKDETVRIESVLPSTWRINEKTGNRLKAEVQLQRVIPSLKVEYSVDNKVKSIDIQPSAGMDSVTNDYQYEAGTFEITIPDGKTNTGWVSTQSHGNSNFLHLISHEDNPLDNSYLLLNSSSALAALARSMPRPGGCLSLFDLGNQQKEEYLGSFIKEFDDSLVKLYPDDNTTLNPNKVPSTLFDFDASYGGYGWEIFYHIPSAIAAAYSNSGQYETALKWLKKIFNPSADDVWQVQPLQGAFAPTNGSVFSTGDIIFDPDRIATDYPFYYQQATIRQTIETMLESGDAAYKEETQESLQKAKATYVEAKQFFKENLPEILNNLSNIPWQNPSLHEAAKEDYDGFLDPYNQTLKNLYDQLENRLSYLRKWLDINGNPLQVPLLAMPIDPKNLQRAGKASLSLSGAEVPEEGDEKESLIDFVTVIRSAKGYIANLEKTSSQLLAAREKLDRSRISKLQRDIDARKIGRSSAIQELNITISEKEVAVKEANLASAASALSLHVGTFLTAIYSLSNAATKDAVEAYTEELVAEVKTKVNVSFISVIAGIPTIFGMASGGQRPEVKQEAQILATISKQIGDINKKSSTDKIAEWIKITLDASLKSAELSSKVLSAEKELSKAKKSLEKENKEKENRIADLADLEELNQMFSSSFANQSFYDSFIVDLELLFSEQWSATQEFCQLLTTLYEDETGATDGSSFLKTKAFGNDVQRLNAPSRLALDIERLETAYIRSLIDQQSQSSQMRFSLSEMTSTGSNKSALATLAEQGETYFELTEDMFDILYPGQYDRRIQSISVKFPGLEKAGISPHARLTQIANTRYLTRERNPNQGAKIRMNRYALQSIVLSTPEVDTANFNYPEGLLKRFQNTGVDSRWHLILPTVHELKNKIDNGRGKAWRDAANMHFEKIKAYLDDVEFIVTFSGRW
ncbi:neuraminidase-like domain-containing protein [Gallaecimonas xiamenensis]|uniref:Toxin complex protein n=1 Tax=Gallaecimonas xiamenensis 3-C-1 TaxID=745411 RepID=K2KC99_9GAMM|nr:neuraminidase-like domain-containing protein [Gallaecimonas xiamenensis]EKE74970.1 toxin complex protein [Gallaecimonas xiamenensis 3-C-1]